LFALTDVIVPMNMKTITHSIGKGLSLAYLWPQEERIRQKSLHGKKA